MDTYDEILYCWKSKEINSEERLAQMLDQKSIAMSYHSGNIENSKVTYNDTREIFEHDGVINYTGDLRTLFENKNSKEAYELFLMAFGLKRKLDEALIKEFQFLLTQNTYDTRRYKLGERPGAYKKHDYVTGIEEVGASPKDTPEEMAELMDELSDFPESKVLTAAAYFHAKFENIHPFADGNGRAGRLAANYLLATNNHPPIVIHQEDRKAYFSGLEAWDKAQNLDPLRIFFKEQTVKTWESQFIKNKEKNYGG
ncbi:MAG: Fic family protein [Eubacterium sp.]|nr:Fic family protein [Eubacterium sp.]